MKKKYLNSIVVCYILSVSFISRNIYAQGPGTTEYQIIHNSADQYLDSVDAFEGLTKYLLKEDFIFRSALRAINIPSGPVLIEHIGQASTSFPPGVLPLLFSSKGYQRVSNQSYIIFYSGLFQQGFAKNPDSLSTAFDIVFYERPIEKVSMDSVSFVFVNGVSDLNKIDIQVPGTGTVVNNSAFALKPIVAYPHPLKSFKLPATPVTFLITDSNGTSQIKAFVGDLSFYKGQQIALFTSGFLHPEKNKNGATMGLFGALKSGQVLEFPSVITSIPDHELIKESSIYVKSSGDEITLVHKNGFENNVEVEFTSIDGKEHKVATKQITNSEVFVSTKNMSEGAYILKIKDGNQFSTLKYFISR